MYPCFALTTIRRILTSAALLFSVLPASDGMAAVGSVVEPGGAGEVRDWQALGTGTDGPIHALALDGRGQLYAGGLFRIAGGREANLLARWDGTDWNPIGGGITDGLRINALAATSTGELFVGGQFRQAGGVNANHIARWNGEEWTALGDGLRLGGIVGGPFASVHEMVIDSQGDLYVGGNFVQAGGVPALNVARWDGTEWRALGEGMRHDGLEYIVYALAIDGKGALYAAGVGGPQGAAAAQAIVARWDGEAWSVLGEPMGGLVGNAGRMVGDLVVDQNGTLYFGGMLDAFSVGYWDGAQWQPLGTRFLGGVNQLAFDAEGNLYASGHAGHSQGDPFTGVAKWDGSRWQGLGEGLLDTSSMASGGPMVVDSLGNLYLGGSFSLAGGMPANNIAVWRGMSVGNEAPAEHPTRLSFAAVYPNPVHGTAWFSLQLATAGPVRVEVFDVVGRLVTTLHEGALAAGTHTWTWERAGYPAGLYFIRASGAGEAVVTRGVVVD